LVLHCLLGVEAVELVPRLEVELVETKTEAAEVVVVCCE